MGSVTNPPDFGELVLIVALVFTSGHLPYRLRREISSRVDLDIETTTGEKVRLSVALVSAMNISCIDIHMPKKRRLANRPFPKA